MPGQSMALKRGTLVWCLGILIALGALHAAVEPAWGYQVTTGTVAPGTRWATPFYVIDSGRIGPTVMVIGGVHGNEPAGYHAAEQIRKWRITRGKLVVVPAANRLGLRNGMRFIPGVGDLNRMFSTRAGTQPISTLARSLWNLMARTQPQWVIDLHESRNYYSTRTGAVGNSIIYYPRNSTTRAAVTRMKAAADRRIGISSRKISLLRYPVQGSLARAAAVRLGAQGMILETTVRDPLNTRIGHHTAMVRSLLSSLNML